MAESIPKQIADVLKTTFDGIVADAGVTYWYKPDSVVVCALTETLWASAGKGKTIYILDPTDAIVTERGQTGLHVLGRLTLRLIVAKDLELASVDPWSLAGARFEVESRLVRDATRAILMDVTLGGITYNTIAETMTIDYGLKMPGSWCAAGIEFEVEYSTPKATP